MYNIQSITSLFIFLFVVPLIAESQTISGRLNTTFYSWQRLDGTVLWTDEYYKVNHFRGSQNIRLAITHGDLSLRTYTQFSMDYFKLTTESEGDPVARFFDFHLRWRNIYDILELNIGRHPIYAGAGRGTIDGGSVRLNLNDGRFTAHIYAGSLVRPFQSGRIQPWNDRRMVGAQLAMRPVRGFYASISYMDRHNRREPYLATRADSLFNPIQVLIDGDSREFQLASTDISYQYGTKTSLYGRFDFNLDDSRPQRIELWSRYTITDDLAVTADYIYREPLVPLNSVFRIFGVESNQEVEAGLEYRLNERLKFTGKFANVIYDGDTGNRVGFAVHSGYGSLSFDRTGGYVGNMTSVSVMTFFPLAQDRWVLTAGSGYARYTPADYDVESDWAFSFLAGFSRKVSSSMSIDFRGQYIRNKVFNRETRLFVRLNYWFFEDLKML